MSVGNVNTYGDKKNNFPWQLAVLKQLKLIETAIVNALITATITANMEGDVAHDSPDSGNPVKIGGRARTSDITVVSNNDRTDAIFDKIGRQVIAPYAIPENFVSGATTDITGTTPTTVIAAPTAGLHLYITQILVTNSHATVGTFVNITEESTGTVLYTGYAAAVGGGYALSFPVPLRVPTAAKALQVTCVTTGSNVRASASGYKGV